jgi:hypothetical protein
MRNTKLFGFLKRKYNRWVWKNLPPCKEIVPIISQSQDRKLTLREKIVLKMHLAACVPCVRYLKQISFLSDALHLCDAKVPETESDTKLSTEAREKIKNLLRSSAVLLALLVV